MEDDWYDDRDAGPVKEEPDCGRCCDSGWVDARFTGRYRARRCPSCDPSLLDVVLNKIRNWWWNWRRPAPTGNEPPF